MENERNIIGQQLPVAHPVECPEGYSPINLIPRALFPDFGGVNRNMPSMSFFGLDRHLGLTTNSNTHNLIDCFHMTSRGHIYQCTKRWIGCHVCVQKKSCGNWIFFYSKQFAKLLTTWLKTIYWKSSALYIFWHFERKACTAFFRWRQNKSMSAWNKLTASTRGPIPSVWRFASFKFMGRKR